MINNKIASFFKKNKLIFLMILSYTLLMFLSPSLGKSALVITKDNLLQLLMVMPIILAMTSLTKAWIPENVISRKLGADSGILGTMLAFVLGSVSAGPIYAAFPFAKALLDKGASLKNITVLLSSWAVIKIPMLANEMAFLGPKFMMTRWILTVIAITILSSALEKLVKPEDIISSDAFMDTTSTVSTQSLLISNKCTGCGVCTKGLPVSFENMITVSGGKANIISGYEIPQSLFEQLKKVCPMNAIS